MSPVSVFVIDHNGECPNQYQLFTKTNQYKGEYPYSDVVTIYILKVTHALP